LLIQKGAIAVDFNGMPIDDYIPAELSLLTSVSQEPLVKSEKDSAVKQKTLFD
jgi:hypothetical protein